MPNLLSFLHFSLYLYLFIISISSYHANKSYCYVPLRYQVNGIDITVAPHDQAVALLTGIRGEILLVVSRDVTDTNPTNVENEIESNQRRNSIESSPGPRAYDDVMRESQQQRQHPDMTSSNDDLPSSARQCVIEVGSPPTTDDSAMPEGVIEREAIVNEATAHCDTNAYACAVTSLAESISPTYDDHSTADGQTNKPEMECRRLPIDGDDCHAVLHDIEPRSRLDMTAAAAAAGGITSACSRNYHDLLRTSEQMMFSNGDRNSDNKRPVTSLTLTEAECRMHAMGTAYEFGLSPPECADVNSTDIHQMIQNDLIQTVTLL